MTTLLKLFTICTICSIVPSVSLADSVKSNATDQIDLAVTIYNSDLAMVRDRRRVNLPLDVIDLAFEDISGSIKPETAQLSSLSGADAISLLEQNFEFDLLSPEALLKAYLGREVGVISTNPATGERTEKSATVLSTQGGVVLQFPDHIETYRQGSNDFVFASVPVNFRARPTLLMTLENTQEGDQDVELNYLSHGLSWQANYVAQLNSDETHLNLNAWVTLTNQSGTSYNNAQLQLVAGDVNTVQEVMYQQDRMYEMTAVKAKVGNQFTQEEAFDYHLYKLSRPTDLKNSQTKQVALFAAKSVPVKKSYVAKMQPQIYMSPARQADADFKVATRLQFVNDDNSNLGSPLPKGTVRIYQNSSDGQALFIGEDRVEHTAKGKIVSLNPGNAFDITAKREQLDFEQFAVSKPYRLHTQTTVRTTIYNAKQTPVKVRVEESIPGEWRIVNGQAVDEQRENTAVWLVEVPGEGETSFTYTLRLKL